MKNNTDTNIRNLWRAELFKEATLWWETLNQVQQNDWACERTNDEVIEDLVTTKMVMFELMPCVRYRYEEDNC